MREREISMKGLRKRIRRAKEKCASQQRVLFGLVRELVTRWRHAAMMGYFSSVRAAAFELVRVDEILTVVEKRHSEQSRLHPVTLEM